MNSRTPLSVAVALVVTACGGLSSPDLGTGEVTGRLTSAKPGAFVYVLGAPDTKTGVAPDGSYTLRDVPITASGTASFVLFDGGDRAEVMSAALKPASRTRAADRDAGAMALAGRVVAAVRCSGGASGESATYAVDAAVLTSAPRGALAELFPLPAGTFNVRAALTGFRGSSKDVVVASGADTLVEIDLEVDETNEERGCVSNRCASDRECNEDDGRCYVCTNDSQCKPDQKCDGHLCVSEGGGRLACEPCSAATDSAGPGDKAPLCIADAAGGGQVCSHGCGGPSDCPSGFACLPTSGGNACVVVSGCGAYFGEFGTACFHDSDCALADPRCAVPGGSELGQCTTNCDTTQDCPSSLGYTCVDRVCTKP